MRAVRVLLTLSIALIGASCGSAMQPIDSDFATPPRMRSTLITSEEIRQRGPYSNLFDLVQSLRPRWVLSQGPDSFVGAQGQVQVHVDGNRFGNVAVLRRLSPAGVTSIRWVPPIEAGARYGIGHSHGVIIVSTSPIH
jgi:hypothetical protein